MDMIHYVRLRFRKDGPQTRAVMGVIFRAGVWMKIPQYVVHAGRSQDVASYVKKIHLHDNDPDSPLLFDVTDEAGARSIEDQEREATERAAAALALPSRISQVDRAVSVAGLPEAIPPVASPINEDGVREKPQVAAPADVSGAPEMKPAEPGFISRRQQRAARQTSDPKPSG